MPIPFDQQGSTGEDINLTSGLGGRGMVPQKSPSFLAIITANNPVAGVNVYSWTEQQQDAGGLIDQAYNPRYGSNTYNPAYEDNNIEVPIGTIVRMREGYVDGTTDMNYGFAHCCGTTVTLTIVTNVCPIVLP